MIIIAVYEDYTPTVFKSQKSLVASLKDYFLDEEKTKPLTEAAVRAAFKEGDCFYLYGESSDEWVYKVFLA